MKIGIPRAFYYHRYSSLIDSFFTSLGHEVVHSRMTDRVMCTFASMMEAELCIPARLYLAHVHDLRGKADMILAPLIYSIARDTYTCPRILAAPKLAGLLWKDLPPLLSPSMWFQQGDHHNQLGRYAILLAGLTGRDADRARDAFAEAVASQQAFEKERWKRWLRKGKSTSGKPAVAFLSHPYILGDPVLSMGISSLLAREGIEVLEQECIPRSLIHEYYSAEKLQKPVTWNSGRELLGAMSWSLQQPEIQGIIVLSYFNCGMDAFMEEICGHQFGRIKKKPVLTVIADEQMSHGTLWNRLDAFLDILRQ
jgi:predicted nucleotide-binding protein (sugar kinase/HSP70/actin superfamily)